MDVNDLRKIFGGMPIESFSAAQILQKKKNRNIVLSVVAVGSFILGVYFTAQYYKVKKDEKSKMKF